MRRQRVVLVCAFLLVFVFTLLYQLTGLKEYIWFGRSITELEGGRRQIAESDFYSVGKGDNILAGVLAGINVSGEGSVLVWNNYFPRHYRGYEDTVYSYYDVCALFLSSTREDKAVIVNVDDGERTVDNDVQEWAKLVKTGDFVKMVLSTDDSGKGKIREIKAYNVPLFLDVDPELLCEK